MLDDGLFLPEVFEDLRTERLAYLRMVLFADDSEWSTALSDVERVVSRILEAPWLSLPPSEADEISWALDGVSEPSFYLPSPAEWRLSRVARTARSRDRLEQLDQIGQRLQRMALYESPADGRRRGGESEWRI